ncbi:hypothetical protein TanjilG_26019 [Lupinus angustifolius]|uniref:Subtilisin-like protease fibronectin type-III domain-containing protein n=1 Tax=Lupinus angustifolius TaxID=3871 RepID=A0A1J7GHF5_LUPAN|nr:hypothetical protein TanjilG_26019 [Lupinus angustifolius]
MLTNQQKEKLSQMECVVSVFPSRNLQLHTTRSWDFIGFPESVKRSRAIESDVVVGVIDTGIWPESDSFNHQGFGPIPKSWKGTYAGGKNFTCNKKIIGAIFYVDESVRDIDGHGTHTASIVAGNNVPSARFYGLAQGTARGGVPSARIAAYKVCGELGCTSHAIMAAFDNAIADVNAAGNNGPILSTISSVAPWILTVAASTIYQRFIDKVVLGNGKTLIGAYLKTFHPDWSPAAIISALMTSAKSMKGFKDDAGEYAYGSGHVNPASAIDPGLVYDISLEDYIQMLCNLGYKNKKVKLISGKNNACSNAAHKSLVRNLNYPTISIDVDSMTSFTIKFKRTVTNVGLENSTYKATILRNPRIKISVVPETLLFKSLHEKQSFVVTIHGGKLPEQNVLTSSLVWSDSIHNVRSPIVLHVSDQVL